MKTNERMIESINKIKSGDGDAFTELYNESYRYIHTCVIHLVKDEAVAQDMIQDTYVAIFRNIDQLTEPEGFINWAATIANRKCFAYLKKKKDILVDEQTDDEGNASDYFENIADDEAFIPENIFDNQEKIRIIRGIIDELTDVQRACVIGFYYNDQKQDQIAEELGIPVNTVKSHLSRAKAKIKDAVGDVEKTQGIKLLSVVPFMVALYGFETKAYAAEFAVPAMSASVAGAVAVKGSVSAGAATAKVTGATTAKVTGAAAKSAGMAVKTKIAIGVAAGVVGVGAVAGLSNQNKNQDKNPFENMYIDISTIEDQVEIFDRPLSSVTRNEAEKFLIDFAESFSERRLDRRDDNCTNIYFEGDRGIELIFTDRIEDDETISYEVYQYNEDGTGGAGRLVFCAYRYIYDNRDQFDIEKWGTGHLSWNVMINPADENNSEETLLIQTLDDFSSQQSSSVIEALECSLLGKGMQDLLSQYDDKLYEEVEKNGRVDFQNGVLTKENEEYLFMFNNLAAENARFWSVRLRPDENGLIDEIAFYGHNPEKLMDSSAYSNLLHEDAEMVSAYDAAYEYDENEKIVKAVGSDDILALP